MGAHEPRLTTSAENVDANDLSKANPEGRFTGLAENYAKFRPTYPKDSIDHVFKLCELGSDSLVVDVGCGTGISSRLFAERGVRVLGVEPNKDMRERAQAEAKQVDVTSVVSLEYVDGTAQKIPLSDGTADVVLAAQAFHWFDPENSLREFLRVLKPGGWVILVWNERDEADAFTRAYGDLLRTLPETASVELPRGTAGLALLESSLYEKATKTCFKNEQTVDCDGLIGRAFSASYAPKEPGMAAQFTEQLKKLFADSERNGHVILRYETSVYSAQKPIS